MPLPHLPDDTGQAAGPFLRRHRVEEMLLERGIIASYEAIRRRARIQLRLCKKTTPQSTFAQRDLASG
jgi:transposase-like protein